ncbi:MAG: glycosyltransferase [Calditrichaeota bacterium]|nr:MAG: glycosyltransferase [Calditrichota bacterium]
MHILFMNSARMWGGNEKWTMMAAGALARRHRVTVAWRSDELGRRLPQQAHSLRLPFLSEADFYTLFRLYRYIKKNKVDALIPTKRKDYFLAAVLSAWTGVANYVRLGIVRALPGSRINRFMFLKHCAGLIVNAQPIRQALQTQGWLPAEKIHVIYNGLDLEALEREARKPAEKPASFAVVSGGLLIERKGFDTLIEAMADFQKARPDADSILWIVGDGPERARLEEKARRMLAEGTARFTGYLENPYAYYAAADVFVLLSGNEGISNALLEAMYLRCAPITTAAGGAARVLENGVNGYLVTKEPATVSRKLTALYDHADRRKTMAEAAHQRVAEMFALERMTRQLEDVLHGQKTGHALSPDKDQSNQRGDD